MAKVKTIWVLPEINGHEEEVSPLSLGLLTEARCIAERVGGTVTALVFGDPPPDGSKILGQYGITRVYFLQDPLLQQFSGESYAAALLPQARADAPWLFIMGHTAIGRELAPRLAALLETGAVTNCANLDFTDPESPEFFRPVYGDQLYQGVVFRTDRTMLVTMDPRVLNTAPVARATRVKTLVIEPELPPASVRVKHREFLPADTHSVDVTEAATIVAAGMGAATDELLPLVEELAALLDGALGTTRPVVDGGKIPRERMIGQTGKVVSPEVYLALGISGATHHVGGIQESGKIVAVNRDPRAPIFRSADVGLAADLQEILPKLIEKIKQAKSHGEIL